MRIRTAFAVTALAASALLGGAGLAAANDGPHGIAGESEFSHSGGFAHYKNLGGPYGITEGTIGGFQIQGEREFLAG